MPNAARDASAPDWPQRAERQNPADTRGIIGLTRSAPLRGRRHRSSYRAPASDATSSANATNPSRWNGARPPATTTNGSSGTASVHSAGSETSAPVSSRTYTRSARQLFRRLTNSSSRPRPRMERVRHPHPSGALRSEGSGAIDESIQRESRAGQHANQVDRPPRLRLPLTQRNNHSRDAVTRPPLSTPPRPVTQPTDAQ